MKDIPRGLPILCVDFDGVIHSYSSGWKGARSIPDKPVDGALRFLYEASKFFEVNIYSSRSRYFGGRWAMKRWLRWHYELLARKSWETTPKWLQDHIGETAFADPWDHEVDYSVGLLIKRFKFPLMKPAAFIQIDDRAITFTGTFPNPESLLSFKPWNKEDV